MFTFAMGAFAIKVAGEATVTGAVVGCSFLAERSSFFWAAGLRRQNEFARLLIYFLRNFDKKNLIIGRALF